MDDSEFQEVVDEVFFHIEDRVDEQADAQAVDIDIDSSSGILTFTLANGSSIILSRQVANHEIWVAAKSGGFHLKMAGTTWRCDTTGEELETLLDRVFTEQAGFALFS